MKRGSLNYILLGMGIGLCHTLSAQNIGIVEQQPGLDYAPGVVVSLRECVDSGLVRNYSVRIARGKEQIAVERATRGNAGMWPSLDLSASYSGTNNDQNTYFRDGTDQHTDPSLNSTITTGLQLSWTVFNGFSIATEYKRLKEMKWQSSIDMRIALEDYVAGVAQSYYSLIRQRIRLQNLLRSVSLSGERLRIVEESYKLGAMSGLEYQQAKVDYNADTASYITQVEQVRKLEINLNSLLELDDMDRHTIPADSVIVPNSALIREQLWNNALLNNADLLHAGSQTQVSRLALKAAQSRNYPYLKITGAYQFRDAFYGDAEQYTYSHINSYGPQVGATAGISIFNGGARRVEQRTAKLSVLNAQLQEESVESSMSADMAQLWMAYQNNLHLWELEKANLEVARSNFDIALERYRLHELSGIELREAQLSLLSSEERLSTAEYNVKICEISLLQLSGDLLSAEL
ncbi:MAG: TolC family protein [Bacteroidaceae bacterium]|nr:TolC family protein [Bacteroidaceae bacterium]